MPTVEERLTVLEQTLATVVRQLHQRFDVLEKALSHQFGMIDARFTRIEQRIEQQTLDFRWKFDESNHYAVETRGIVAMHQLDIREMKEDIKEVKDRLDTLENKTDNLGNKVDSLENKMDLRFDQVIALIKNQNN